jgi:hypothetical protein
VSLFLVNLTNVFGPTAFSNFSQFALFLFVGAVAGGVEVEFFLFSLVSSLNLFSQ